jgi:hypothetical protein
VTGRWFPDFCFFVTAEGTGEKGRRGKKSRQKVACSFPCSSLPPFPLEWKKRIAEGKARKEKSYSDLSVQKQGTAREVLLFFVHFRVLFFFFEKVVVCFFSFFVSVSLSSPTEPGRSARCAPGPGAAAWPGSPWDGGRA